LLDDEPYPTFAVVCSSEAEALTYNRWRQPWRRAPRPAGVGMPSARP